MAQFYGTLQGNRGQATRMGTKSSGIESFTASWHGAVRVYLYVDSQTGQETAWVSFVPWHGVGKTKTLYHGPWPPIES